MRIADIQVTPIHPERWGNDLDVVNAARVSFHKESTWEMDLGRGEEILSFQDRKLIYYLAKHKHFSPFNHSFISVRVKAPIFVARQLVKHKFMPWNEVSRRYVDDEPEFYFPDYWRKKADNVKQGSSDEKAKLIPLYDEHEDLWGDIDNDFEIPLHTESAVSMCLSLYDWMIKSNCSAEQARMILPQNMMTEWIWSGTLGAFCDMLILRLDPHTQYESRIVANKIKELIEPVFPVSLKARLENV